MNWLSMESICVQGNVTNTQNRLIKAGQISHVCLYLPKMQLLGLQLDIGIESRWVFSECFADLFAGWNMDDDDDDISETAPMLVYNDIKHTDDTLLRLNTLRKGSEFCDTILEVCLFLSSNPK